MAQRIITADSVIPVADTTTIAALRTTMAAGSVITANNINTLATFINNWLGHYHAYTDAYQLPEYGNNGDRTNYVENKNTSTLIGAPTTISAVTNSTIIAATKHNEFRSVSNILGHHYHTIDDRIA
jgi:hypothetical protein